MPIWHPILFIDIQHLGGNRSDNFVFFVTTNNAAFSFFFSLPLHFEAELWFPSLSSAFDWPLVPIRTPQFRTTLPSPKPVCLVLHQWGFWYASFCMNEGFSVAFDSYFSPNHHEVFFSYLYSYRWSTPRRDPLQRAWAPRDICTGPQWKSTHNRAQSCAFFEKVTIVTDSYNFLLCAPIQLTGYFGGCFFFGTRHILVLVFSFLFLPLKSKGYVSIWIFSVSLTQGVKFELVLLDTPILCGQLDELEIST